MKPNTVFVIAVGIALILDLFTGFFAITVTPPTPQPVYGVWNNFASDPSCTSLPSPANPPGYTPCELFNETRFRPLYIYNNPIESSYSGLNVGLEAGCLTAGQANDIIQLQYANYSFTSGTNSSNFANIGLTTIIDNSVPSGSCPGVIDNQADGTLPTISVQSPQGFIFRVIGLGAGGNVGDSPRFAWLMIALSQQFTRSVTVTISPTSTTGFSYVIGVNIPFPATNNISIRYIATNQTSTCGTLEKCLRSGTATCTFSAGNSKCSSTVTFSSAFTGSVQVTANPTGFGTSTSTAFVPAGTIPIYSIPQATP